MVIKIKLLNSVSKEQFDSLNKLYLKYFKPKDNEADLNFKKINLLLRKFPESDAIVIDNKTIIGETTTIPTNKKLMTEFLKNKITEQELVDQSIKKVTLKNFNAIYLCYMLLEKKYRRRDITLKEHKQILEHYLKYKKDILLFVWPLSKAGEKTAKKVSEIFNLPLIIKK